MLYLRFENHHTTRYYRILLSKDMFDDWVLTKVWGGINKATGRVVHLPCETLETAMLRVQQLVKIRLKRGYLLVDKRVDPAMLGQYQEIAF
jgi:hypothetical protein